jgi:16S rRNA (adenine1518-N6/adenine1519-N6)-dimethyltransferase
VWVAKVVRAIDPKSDDVFVEIGPGRGALTGPLADRAKAVIAFEIDRDLVADLRQTALPNVTVIEGDFLESAAAALERYRGTPLRVAGNLPYNVASPILFKLIDLFSSGLVLADATVMLQREVADRLVARPGTRDYGVLSIHMQQAADVERLLTLPPGAFRPPPKVHSALVRLRFHQPSPVPRDPAIFAAVIQAIFTRRRKTLANALLAYPEKRGRGSFLGALREAGLDGTRRPETLTIAELVRLADAVAGLPGKRRAVLP